MDLDCAAQLGSASGNVAFTLFPWFVGGWLLNVYGLWRLVRRDMLTWTHGLAGAIPGLLFGQSLRPANTAALSALNASEWKRKSAAIVNGICQQAEQQHREGTQGAWRGQVQNPAT